MVEYNVFMLMRCCFVRRFTSIAQVCCAITVIRFGVQINVACNMDAIHISSDQCPLGKFKYKPIMHATN